MSTSALETESKIAFDQQSAALAAQRTDLKDMQARAKDLIGLITLAGTFLAAFDKESTGGLIDSLATRDQWWTYLFFGLPGIVFLACIFVMTPNSKWVFNIDGQSIVESMEQRNQGVGFRDAGETYREYARAISRFVAMNVGKLRQRKWALWTAIACLCAEVALVVHLGIQL